MTFVEAVSRLRCQRIASHTEPSSPWTRFAPRLLGFGIATQLVFFVLYRRVNLDEGWYLWASKLVFEGQLPYRDFAYTQAPLLPYIYGLVGQIAGYNLYAGRALTALLALAGALMAGAIARRRGGLSAEVLTLALIAGSLFTATAYTYTATYALTAFFLVLAAFLATGRLPEDRRAALAGLALAAAAGVRLSVIAALPFMLLLVALCAQRRWRSLLIATGATAAGLALVFGPFLLLARENMIYDVFGFHTDRTTLAWQAAAVQNTARETVTDFAVLLAATVTGAAAQLARRRRPAARAAYAVELLLGLAALVLYVAHFIPRTTNPAYNALQAPLVAALAGILWARVLAVFRPRPLAVAALATLLLVGSGLQQWPAIRRNWLVAEPPRNQVETVRAAAAYLRENTPVGGQLISFNTHLALEADLRVPRGFEMSIFSYHPTWSTEKAERYRFINNELLLAALERGADAVALSGVDLNLLDNERENILAVIHNRYRWAHTVLRFDPYDQDLRIYLPPRFDLPALQFERQVALADGVTFLGHDLAGREGVYRAGEQIHLTLYWRATTTPQQAWTVFTHVLGAQDEVVAGYDNPPCRRTCPTTAWRAGEVISDEYWLRLPADLAAGRYRLEIGLYDAATGARLPLLTPSAAEGDRILLAPITVQ